MDILIDIMAAIGGFATICFVVFICFDYVSVRRSVDRLIDDTRSMTRAIRSMQDKINMMDSDEMVEAIEFLRRSKNG